MPASMPRIARCSTSMFRTRQQVQRTCNNIPRQPGLIVRKHTVQRPVRLTDLLRRPPGTGETTRDTGDTHRELRPVRDTHRNAGHGEDARHVAHNPATTGNVSRASTWPERGAPATRNRPTAQYHSP